MAAPATTVGNAAELLDVHMDQLAGSMALVPAGGFASCTNTLTSERIAVGEVRYTMARQDRSHRARRDAQLGANPVRPAALLVPHLQDLRFDFGRGAAR
jgi:hypothetical protein